MREVVPLFFLFGASPLQFCFVKVFFLQSPGRTNLTFLILYNLYYDYADVNFGETIDTRSNSYTGTHRSTRLRIFRGGCNCYTGLTHEI